MTDLTDSQQNTYGANLVIGLRDGNQTVAPSDLAKYRQVFLTGASVTGRIVTVPQVAALKNFTADRDNAFPVTVKRGTTEIIINPGQIKTLETDGSANGLSDETGSPALAGFSDEVPLPDEGEGDPGSSVYPARADHVHPQAEGAVTSVAGRGGDVVIAEEDVTNLAADLASLTAGQVQLQSAKLDKTGGTMTGALTLSGAPVAALDAATKAYVDATAQGLAIKASVKAATTANITLSGAQTIDGVSVTAGMRVLVKNQTAPEENGIYVAASGSWSRASDADVWTELPGAFTFVEAGSANAGSSWVCNVASGGTLGTTAVTFAQFGAGSSYTAGALIDITGSTIATKVSGTAPLENAGSGSAGSADAAARSDHAHPVKKAILKTANYTAVHGEAVLADSSGGSFTVNVPTGGTVGQKFSVIDPSDSWATNAVTLGRNSQTIMGLAEDMTLNIAGLSLDFIHNGSTWSLA